MSIAHIYQRTSTEQPRLSTLPQRILAVEATNITQALNEAAAIVRDETSADVVAIMVVDPSTATLHRIGFAEAIPNAYPIPAEVQVAEGGIQAEVYATGTPYLARSDADAGDHAVVILPLTAGDDRHGIVQVVMAQSELAKSRAATDLKAAVQAIGVLLGRANRLEAMLTEAAQQARCDLIEDLASTLNHDLRNMMAPISGRLDLIRRQANREGHEKYVRHAEEASLATRRMQAVLQNLVEVARLEQGEMPLYRQQVALGALVRSVAANIHISTMEPHFDIDDTVEVSVDPQRIQQVLEHLIGNALRYSPEDQAVVITVRRREENGATWAELSVCDQGARIAPDVLPLVFSHWITGRGSNGFNLSFYLAQGITKAHGGTMNVTSDEATGTTWTVTLPLAEPAA